MFQSKTYEIKSCDDEELGIKRDSLLEFTLYFDDEKEMKALFFFIDGCGRDIHSSYVNHLAQFVVKEFQVAVILVNYHCIGNRFALGAKVYFDCIDLAILHQSCQTLGITSPKIAANEDISKEEYAQIILYIDGEIEKLKNAWRFDYDKKLTFLTSYSPTKNEYQNFGLMQALDILNVLCFVKNNPPFALAKDYKSLLFGTSHGGYIAFLASKFAPWLIDAVVENSGYVDAHYQYLGFLKEIDYTKCSETHHIEKNSVWITTTKTHFTSDKNSAFYFSPAFEKIRSMSEHLEVLARSHKIVYVSYHSINDTIALPQKKQELYEKLSNLGFEAKLKMIKDESEVDGKFIKNLRHGMDMSMKTLIQKELPPLLEREFKHGKNEKKQISYLCDDLEYCFEEQGGGD